MPSHKEWFLTFLVCLRNFFVIVCLHGYVQARDNFSENMPKTGIKPATSSFAHCSQTRLTLDHISITFTSLFINMLKVTEYISWNNHLFR